MQSPVSHGMWESPATYNTLSHLFSKAVSVWRHGLELPGWLCWEGQIQGSVGKHTCGSLTPICTRHVSAEWVHGKEKGRREGRRGKWMNPLAMKASAWARGNEPHHENGFQMNFENNINPRWLPEHKVFLFSSYFNWQVGCPLILLIFNNSKVL